MTHRTSPFESSGRVSQPYDSGLWNGAALNSSCFHFCCWCCACSNPPVVRNSSPTASLPTAVCRARLDDCRARPCRRVHGTDGPDDRCNGRRCGLTNELASIWHEIIPTRGVAGDLEDLQILRFGKGSAAEMRGLFRVSAHAANRRKDSADVGRRDSVRPPSRAG